LVTVPAENVAAPTPVADPDPTRVTMPVYEVAKLPYASLAFSTAEVGVPATESVTGSMATRVATPGETVMPPEQTVLVPSPALRYNEPTPVKFTLEKLATPATVVALPESVPVAAVKQPESK
jgi:hypothetical protein